MNNLISIISQVLSQDRDTAVEFIENRLQDDGYEEILESFQEEITVVTDHYKEVISSINSDNITEIR